MNELSFRPQSHVELINDIVDKARERFGIELLGFIHLLHSSPDKNVSLESFGEGIRWNSGPTTEMDVVCLLRIGDDGYIFLADRTFVKVDYKSSRTTILEKMDIRNKGQEKDDWRTKLQSVGINPKW